MNQGSLIDNALLDLKLKGGKNLTFKHFGLVALIWNGEVLKFPEHDVIYTIIFGDIKLYKDVPIIFPDDYIENYPSLYSDPFS